MIHITMHTWVVLLTGITFILLGYFLYATSCTFITNPREYDIVVNDRMMIAIILIMSFMIILGTIFKIQELSRILGGASVFFTDPARVRATVIQINDGIYPLSIKYKIAEYMINAGMPVSIIGGIFFATFSKYRYIGLISITSSTLVSLVNLSRYLFLANIIFFVIAYFYTTYYYSREKRILLIRRFIRLLVGVLIFTLAIFSIISRARTSHTANVADILYKNAYFYLIGGIPSLNIFLLQNHHFLYGASMLRSVVKWLIRLGMWDPLQFMGTYDEFVTVSPGIQLNTYTFALNMYQDFGLPGTILVSFIWGWVSRWVIQRYLTKFSLVNLLWVSIFTLSLVRSSFTFIFQGISVLLYWLFIIYIVQVLFGKRMISMNSKRDKEQTIW